MVSNLSLSLLGRFRASYNGEPLTRFGSNKVQALLIYLTVTEALNEGHDGLRHRREAVMELLWPGSLPQSAQNNLRQTIYKLRQLLPTLADTDGQPAEFILSERLTVRLNPQTSYDLDIATFHQHLTQTQAHNHDSLHSCSKCQARLQQAVTLYQGDFLSDFFLEDSNEFEGWAWNLRALHRRQVLDALDTLTLMMLRQGQHNQARAYAEQQLVIDRLRESAYRQLMEILAISGQPSEALAQYERLCQLLQDEMGMAPMAQTTAVYEQIRAGELGIVTKSETAVRGYDLQEEIGAGAFGVVYRARQPHVNRDVAVKIIAPDLANQPDFIRRFEVEAQLIARLEHPHIVPLYDYWREPNAAYLVMRYLRGGNLEQQLTHGPLPPTKVGRMLEQICAALQVGHQQNIVHRDIKPANILLDETGNAYLSDFGIAKELGSQRHLTEVGALVGTPDFISPEQFSTEPVSAASDMYSLGIVLFQMLTGRLPFPEASISELIYKHLHERIPSVYRLQPNLPPTVDEVIWQATAKQPQDRFPTITAMAVAFHEALRQEIAPDEAYIVPIAPGIEVSNPYKGLRPFQEADSDDFYGREALVHQLVSRLTLPPSPSEREGRGGGEERFLAVVGPSGSGKSSVVKAGLIPALRRGNIPGAENWFVVEMVPGTHPLEELEAALLHVAVNPPPSLLEPLQKDERGLARTLKRILPAMSGDERPQLLLIIDQFEELFTLVTDKAVRQHFLASLLAALADKRSQLRLVITLRADFYDRPLQHPDLGELLRQRTEVVLPLTLAELEQAIIRPATRMGVRFEAGLATQIAVDVTDQPGTLPLLQYALTEMFEQRQNGVLTAVAYEAIGGVLGALGRRADEIYEELAAAERVVARQLFLRLVTLGEGVDDTRRRVLRSELRDLETPGVYKAEPVVERAVTAFGRFRLLTFDRDPLTRSPTVEVAHEALLREWEQLRGWLEQNREDVRQQRRLAQAAAEWQQVEQNEGFLLRGIRLDQFAGWTAETSLALTGNERTFLQASLAARASRQAEEEARRQRELETVQQLAQTEHHRAEEQILAAHHLRRRAFYLTAALVIAAVLAVMAFSFASSANRSTVLAATREAEALSSAALAATRQVEAEAQARLARSRALAGAAITNLESDPELSMLLALQAFKITYEEGGIWTTEAEMALHQAVQKASRLRLNLSGHVNPLNPVLFNADGTHLIGLDYDGRSKIWDAVIGQELLAVAGSNAILSSDGQYLITLVENEEDDGLTRIVWDTATGEAIASSSLTINLKQELTVLAFDPFGTVLAAGYEDGTVDIWDFAAESAYQLQAHASRVNDLAFSAGGEYLVMASSDQSATVYHLPLSAGATTSPAFTVSDPSGEIFKVALSSDNLSLVTVNDRHTAIIWHLDLASGEATEQSTFSVASHNSPIAHIVFSPDGLWLASAGDDKVLLWEVLTGHIWLTLPGGAVKIAFSPDSNRLLAASANSLKIWDLTPAGSKEKQTLAGHEALVWGVAFSPDGARLGTAGLDSTAAVWDWDSSERLLTLNGHEGPVQDIQFSPDGMRVATAGHDSTARIWDANTGQELLTLRGHGRGRYRPWFEGIQAVAFSPDGARLATAGLDGTARIWDTQTGQPLLVLSDHSDHVKRAVFSPDGAMLATVDGDLTFHAWDAHTGEELFTVSTPAEITDVSFNPNGQWLAAAIRDGSIKIWDVGQLLAAGQRGAEVAGDEMALLTLAGHTPFAWAMTFSPDNNYLASISSVEIIIWDLATRRELLSLPAGQSPYGNSASFSPDGRYLAAGKADGTTRVFVLTVPELVALAQSRLTRGWAMAECIQYHIDPCPSSP